MGSYNKGILGPFSGKVGTVVGASWRGRDIMRSLPKRTNRTPTETQLLQRQLFTTVSEFLTPISAVLSRYYGQQSGVASRRNKAMSYHMKQAVNFNDPDFVMLYNKVQISRGDLLGLQEPEVVAMADSKIKFTWTDNSDQGEAKTTDRLVVVVYEPLSNQFFYVLNAATRVDGTATVNLPGFFSGLTVHSWIAFASEDEKSYATSIHMGTIVVT